MPPQSRGLGELLRDLAHGGADLLRGEIRLARIELTTLASRLSRGTVLVALGAVLLVLGSLSAAAGIVLLSGDQWLPSDMYGLAALMVVVITAALAAWFARRGIAHLKPSQLVPDETLETLKEDKEWLRQQLKSGATSR